MRTLAALALAFAAVPALAAPTSIDPGSGGAPAAATGSSPAATQVAGKQKIRCRIDYEIGSLVKRTRRCGDAETWRKADAAMREQTLRIQQDNTGRYELPR